MNKLILTVGAICTLSSCLQDKKLYEEPNVQERINNCITSEIFQVPVKEGYTTIVTCGDDTLAVTDRSIPIVIPKQTGVQSKSEANSLIKIDYSTLKITHSYSKYWQAVMFEDTERGDYDYNDLIFHVKNTCNTWKDKPYSEQTIEIQPIALGGTKAIKLGCLLGPDSKEYIISEDVRKDLFHGVKGYINTLDSIEPVRYKLAPTPVTKERFEVGDLVPTIAWFIEVDGKKYYAISGDVKYNNYMVNNENMPYGLVIYGVYNETTQKWSANGTFSYPKEKHSIFNAYPDFSKWINGQASSIGEFDKTHISKFCQRIFPDKAGNSNKQWIWDYDF